MLVELEHEDLVNLVTGVRPAYRVMSSPKINQLGTYNGSHDNWSWNTIALNNVDEEELWQIYHFCKLSWEDIDL